MILYAAMALQMGRPGLPGADLRSFLDGWPPV